MTNTIIRGTSKPTERDYQLNELYLKVINDNNLKIRFDNNHFLIITFKVDNIESIERAKKYMVFRYPNEEITKEEKQLIIYPN